MPERVSAEDAKAILAEYEAIFDASHTSDEWFGAIKELAAKHGFAPETKLFKQNPDEYKGPVGDISMVLRVAVCGRTNAPDLQSVMNILGAERVTARLRKAAAAL